ncbi:MAG: hypothetical protein AAGU74_14865 [Bacillota bacterium]
MKKYVLVLCAFLLMIAVTGCLPSNKTNSGGGLEPPETTQTPRPTQSNKTDPKGFFQPPVTTQTPPPTQSSAVTATPSPAITAQTVVDTTLTLDFAFGQRTGTYSGPMVNGVPEGTGIFTAINSEGAEWTYEGAFRSGHFEGQGTTTWSDNWSEKGTYVNDYLAMGERFYKGICVYRGPFANDEYNGRGTTYDETGHVIYEGEFKNGYLDETEEQRITRADMIAPESTAITKKNFKTIFNNAEDYIGKWVEVYGKTDYFWDEEAGPYTEFLLLTDGDVNCSVDVWYRYGVDEERIQLNDNVRVFGVLVSAETFTEKDETYSELLVEAHVIYID